MFTIDRATIDSTGAFLVGELERMDQTLNMPLVSYKWSRDMPLRSDISIADEVSSFTNTDFVGVVAQTLTVKTGSVKKLLPFLVLRSILIRPVTTLTSGVRKSAGRCLSWLLPKKWGVRLMSRNTKA